MYRTRFSAGMNCSVKTGPDFILGCVEERFRQALGQFNNDISGETIGHDDIG